MRSNTRQRNRDAERGASDCFAHAAMGRRGSWLVVALFACAWPIRAWAGPPETFVQVAFHPSDPMQIALRYDQGGGGMLLSRDGGRSWQLVCAALLFDPVATHTD